MLKDFTPHNQNDRILLEIHDLLVSINEKLNKETEEEIVVETKQKRTRNKKEVIDNV